MKTMDTIVKEIITKINKGVVFDSHYIIDTIILNYSDDYFRFISDNLAKAKITEYAHSKIAKTIKSNCDNLVEDTKMKSLSYNIRGKPSLCELWKKV